MTTFRVGTPVETTESSIEVTANSDSMLAVGRHVFRLVVVDDSGNVSKPSDTTVVVLDDQAPTAILKAPGRVSAGQSFMLDGSASTDLPPGKIVSYTWTLVD
jgi:hypothetical protein